MYNKKAKNLRFTKTQQTTEGTLVGRYRIHSQEGGTLRSYMREETDADASEQTWYVYLEEAKGEEDSEKETIDVLDYVALSEYIMTFSDELPEDYPEKIKPVVIPEVMPIEEEKDFFLPWTVGFEEDFAEEYGYKLADYLPELIWKLKRGTSLHRKHYEEYIGKRFADCCYGQLEVWCRGNGVKFPYAMTFISAGNEENSSVYMDI